MYALSDYIGEEKLNGALKKFLERNKYAKGPYPTPSASLQPFVKTPPELQYLVTDMFESIVLYENKTVSAVATPEPGNKIQVTLTVNTAKRKADGSGNETPMALNDLIDVGVFSGTKEHLKPLHMEKQWFKTDSSTVALLSMKNRHLRASIPITN
jgi:ABC-2 type transport system permease protein